ncbi:MAG: hypothetical protein ACOC93_01115, partial [Planctomycetota bacterium]
MGKHPDAIADTTQKSPACLATISRGPAIMHVSEPKSFSEVSILEAVARRARVHLIQQGAEPEAGPLVSRFLQMPGAGRVAVAIPEAKGGKVLLQPGTE